LFLSNQGLFVILACQQVGWGCTRSWEGTQPGQLTPTDQRNIPYHKTSCSTYKAGGRRRKWGDIGSYGILSSQVTTTSDGAMLSWRWLNTYLEVVNELLVLLCLCAWLLLHLLDSLYLNPRVFLLLPF